MAGGAAGRGAAAVRPAMRLMQVVLSNGASLRMPTAATRTKPFFANQDLYQHSAWMVRVKGLEAQVDSKKAMDFSDFYKKFGLQQGDDEEEDEGGAAGSSTR